jgi:hypothetical protein
VLRARDWDNLRWNVRRGPSVLFVWHEKTNSRAVSLGQLLLEAGPRAANLLSGRSLRTESGATLKPIASGSASLVSTFVSMPGLVSS